MIVSKEENHAWNIEQEILAHEENLTQAQQQLDAGAGSSFADDIIFTGVTGEAVPISRTRQRS